jgi:zinc protease
VHYDVGSADDPPDKEGLAHLVEHLMFDGFRQVAPGEFSRLLARAGAVDVNGRTSFDATN